MIVCLSSVSGAPGVTSWALLLAAAWPADYGVERIVVEAGRDGGVLGARYPQVGVVPGVAELAAACRRRAAGGTVTLDEFARDVGGGVWVVPEPEPAEAVEAVWSTVSRVAAVLAADPRLWLVDAGRLAPGSPALALSAAAALSLVWTGPSHEELVQVPARVAALQADGTAVGVVVAGPCGYGTAELAGFFRTGLVWSVPQQRDLLSTVSAVLAGGRAARRSWVWRQAVSVAAGLADQVTADLDADVEAGDVR